MFISTLVELAEGIFEFARVYIDQLVTSAYRHSRHRRSDVMEKTCSGDKMLHTHTKDTLQTKALAFI